MQFLRLIFVKKNSASGPHFSADFSILYSHVWVCHLSPIGSSPGSVQLVTASVSLVTVSVSLVTVSVSLLNAQPPQPSTGLIVTFHGELSRVTPSTVVFSRRAELPMLGF